MIMDHLKEALMRLENKGRLRSLSSAQGVDFTSNDYLGFATHPELVKAGELFFSQGGAVGSAASRLLHGYMDEHFQQHTETYDGLTARVIQHELDHLNGILLIDHLSFNQRQSLQGTPYGNL